MSLGNSWGFERPPACRLARTKTRGRVRTQLWRLPERSCARGLASRGPGAWLQSRRPPDGLILRACSGLVRPSRPVVEVRQSGTTRLGAAPLRAGHPLREASRRMRSVGRVGSLDVLHVHRNDCTRRYPRLHRGWLGFERALVLPPVGQRLPRSVGRG